MKCLAAVLLALALAFAADQNGAEAQGQETAVPPSSDDISITMLNTWQALYASHILGLEYRDDVGDILFVSNLNNKIFIADPDDGAQLGSIDRPAGMYGFDVAWDGTEYYVNGWSTSAIYHGTGGGWTSFTNPAGTNGRGMAFDGAQLWESNSSAGAYTFNTDGTGALACALPGINLQISGLATFPLPTENQPCGLMVTCYNQPTFYFYTYNGSSITPIGSAPCPTTVTQSLGLTYSQTRDTFFWSYVYGGAYYVAELDIEMGAALEKDHWGNIKTQF